MFKDIHLITKVRFRAEGCISVHRSGYSGQRLQGTECPKIYRKSVLQLLKYRSAIYLSDCSTNLQELLGHSVREHFKE